MDKFLNPEEFNIDNLFKGKYMIPIYQRPYSWGKDEVNQLLKDIMESYELYKKANINSMQVNNEEMLIFTGTLFIKINRNIKNTYTEYDIVDGQQRITTITLMLMVILNYCYKIGSNDDIVLEIENYLWKKVERKRDKDSRVLTLGNIDKYIMIELFDELYAKNDIIEYANNRMESNTNDIEKNLLKNILEINTYYNSNFINENDYYDYYDYIKYNVRFIAIEVHTNLVKLFSIFESINSKGKPLEEIDLIKSYIFQNIYESDYNEYLNKWGKLIKKTNDKLMEYLIIYVRANISYYRNNIKLANFKTLVEGEFKRYYGCSNIRDVLLHFIDDMLQNVKYYIMLYDYDMLNTASISKKSIDFFMMNNIAEYNHTNALYFKLLSMKNMNSLSEKTFDNIVEQAFKFVLTFQSICSRESKKTLGVFVDIQNQIYNKISSYNDKSDLSNEDFANITNIFKKAIVENSITNEIIRSDIKKAITYHRNRKVVKILLSYLEYMDNSGNAEYTKLYWILKLGSDIQIDHILPLNPDKNDNNYKYYIEGNKTFLKEGQDFILNNDNDFMIKEDFYDQFLHVIGNLRLEWKDDNIRKSNKLIDLKEFDKSFNTSNQISKRTSTIIKKIIDSNMIMSMDNIGDISNYKNIDNIFMINEYDNKFDYKNYKPVSFELLDEKYIMEKFNYTQLLIKVVDVLYGLEKNKFVELANQKYCPMSSDRIYISTDKKNMKEAHMLTKDIFIETDLSSPYIIKFIYILIREIGLETSDMKIDLKKNNK